MMVATSPLPVPAVIRTALPTTSLVNVVLLSTKNPADGEPGVLPAELTVPVIFWSNCPSVRIVRFPVYAELSIVVLLPPSALSEAMSVVRS